MSAAPMGMQLKTPFGAVPADAAGTGRVRALVFLRDRGIIILWLLLVAVFAVWAQPHFFTWTNARLVADAAALSALFAAAVAFGILSGALDLSIPGTAALAGVVAGKLLEGGTPSWVAIIAAIGVGVAVGLVNGVLVQRGLNSLVVSIATLTAARRTGQPRRRRGGDPRPRPTRLGRKRALARDSGDGLHRRRPVLRVLAVPHPDPCRHPPAGSRRQCRGRAAGRHQRRHLPHPRLRPRGELWRPRRSGDGGHHQASDAVGIGQPAVRRAHGGRPVRDAADRRPGQLPEGARRHADHRHDQQRPCHPRRAAVLDDDHHRGAVDPRPGLREDDDARR